MVSTSNGWKLDPSFDFSLYQMASGSPIEDLKNAIEKEKANFAEENRHYVKPDVLKENEYLAEKAARETLLDSFLFYAKSQGKIYRWNVHTKENRFYTFHLTLEKMKRDLDEVVNRIFPFEVNGHKLTKQRGECTEHYLMRGIILQHINAEFGVSEFNEEYSKIKEALREVSQGRKDKKKWEKSAKRADLYVILKDGTKLWVEVERATSNQQLNYKLRRIKTVSHYFPNLIDKVVFVFPNMLIPMTEGLMVEAKKTSFPEERLEICEVNIQTAQIRFMTKKALIRTEFGNRLLDYVADDEKLYGKITGKVALNIRHLIQKGVIVPLINGSFKNDEWIRARQDKIKRLVKFWRARTTKFTVSESEIERKKDAIKKLKLRYSFLFEKSRQNYR